jgi:EAL domain-containing protein (putative c-di-GMP-specific phosphodiesterase class I)
VKFDRSFIGEIAMDADHKVIVSAMIELAHALSLKVVAEGVETTEQLTQLRSLGCDIVQGNYFSKPLSGEAADAALAAYCSPVENELLDY